MDFVQIITSLVSGGLAGGSVSTLLNRVFHRRALRTQFYPKVNNVWSAYVIQFAKEGGRYLIQKPGWAPTPEMEPFVETRGSFMMELVEFNELKEARELRRKMAENQAKAQAGPEGTVSTDLTPEYEAISKCFHTLHKKLKL
jgi:hypothetical protein